MSSKGGVIWNAIQKPTNQYFPLKNKRRTPDTNGENLSNQLLRLLSKR